MNIRTIIRRGSLCFPVCGMLMVAVLHSAQAGAGEARPDSAGNDGACYTGKYPNLFASMLGKTPHEITARLDSTYHRLFFGDNETQRVYYPFGADRAYIMDVANNDVRTEGMSYGMMIAVQLDKKEVFDRLWTWAVTHMKFTSGPHAGYFAWHCKTDGTVLDSTAASDGEEWFTMSLLFASARWGNGTGIFNYRAQALDILHSMLHKQSELDHGRVTDMFDTEHKLVRFVPSAGGDRFTDPSYQLPHFYELWARWSDVDNAFWCDAAGASRLLLRRACHQSTGLAPDYSEFDGRPMSSDPGGHGDFRFDAWRVAMNIAMDWVWFARDTFEVAQSNRLLTFFHDAQINKYGNQFSLDGKQLSDDHSTGLVAANAVAALAATIPGRRDFVEALWDATTPSGYYRYYDGMLYLLGMLELSGNFRIYDPMGGSFPACKE